MPPDRTHRRHRRTRVGTPGRHAAIAAAQMKADGEKVLDNLPTTAPDVKTDPGPAPVTDLAGQADPVRTVGDHQHAMPETAKALDAARLRVISGPGAAAVQPAKLDEKLAVPGP